MKKSGKREGTLRKQAGITALRKARGFVVFTLGYDGALHIESDVSKLGDVGDYRQVALNVVLRKVQDMAVAATEMADAEKEHADQAAKVVEAKEKRSKELQNEI